MLYSGSKSNGGYLTSKLFNIQSAHGFEVLPALKDLGQKNILCFTRIYKTSNIITVCPWFCKTVRIRELGTEEASVLPENTASEITHLTDLVLVEMRPMQEIIRLKTLIVWLLALSDINTNHSLHYLCNAGSSPTQSGRKG